MRDESTVLERAREFVGSEPTGVDDALLSAKAKGS
jgi:hypothetical protein